MVYGEIEEAKDLWKSWIFYAKSSSIELDRKLTHVSILCNSLNSRLKTLSRSKKLIGDDLIFCYGEGEEEFEIYSATKLTL